MDMEIQLNMFLVEEGNSSYPELDRSTTLMYRDRSEKEEAQRKIKESIPGKFDLSHIHRHTEWDMLLHQMFVLSVREFMRHLWPCMCSRHRLQKTHRGSKSQK